MGYLLAVWLLLHMHRMGCTSILPGNKSTYLYLVPSYRKPNAKRIICSQGRSLEEVNLIFSGALIDQRPGAHHPETAAEALMQLQELRRREERMRARRAMAQSRQNSFAKRLTRVEDIEKQETTLH